MHLVLDTTSPGLTLGLYREGAALAQIVDPTPRAADLLHTHLAEILQKHSLTAANLTHLTLTVGPGSFTGARIGLAVAQALLLTNPALITVGLSTLQAHACQLAATGLSQSFTILLDAAGHTVYRQTFAANGTPTTQAECVETTQAIESLSAGQSFAAAPTLMLPVQATLALAQLQPQTLLSMSTNPTFHLPLAPLYIKPLTYKKAV